MEIATQANTMELVKAEIDTQIATAKQYPRDLEKSLKNCRSMISLSPDVAASCNYSLTKGNNIIEGPSIRLAEIVMNNWGNIRAQARVVNEDNHFVYVQGVCHDLESNTAVSVDVKRRITYSNGKKYNADMIQTVSQAAVSIAIRNALFKVVPYAYVEVLREEAKKAVVGNKSQLAKRIDDCTSHFKALGVTEETLCKKIGVQNAKEMSEEKLLLLLGIATSLQQGLTSLENEFGINQTKQQAPEASNHASRYAMELSKYKEAIQKLGYQINDELVVDPKTINEQQAEDLIHAMQSEVNDAIGE
jgi:hypothetical protein